MAATILLIDDDDLFINTVRFVLESHEYEVLVAVSGAKGIEMAREHLPDLILCDIHMRDGHGYATVMAVRNRLETGNIPVVMMTGKGNPFVEKKSRLHGADYYLEKPFTVSKLLETTELALHNKREITTHSRDVIFPASSSGKRRAD